jgi:hypothetical protein
MGEHMTAFCTLFLRHLRALGIPCHVAFYHALEQRVDIVHSLQGDAMPPLCHEVLGHLAMEIAKRNGLPIEWGGLSHPTQYRLTSM